ncbi:MAG TPA: polyphosphate kinase 2 family protein [Vicinamibacterales bacterium]|nr:polyphosphate kinase 2 family protein [Vicinamibacterales bacterium]
MDIRRFQAPPNGRFHLSRHDPGDHAHVNDKRAAERLLTKGIERLRDLQEKLYAQDRWSVLLVLQALDAAGKDGAIEHVMSGVNPQGCRVVPFKRPSEEELDHDYLWRVARELPPRGEIGIFNRSHYEEVLVVRVHEDALAREKLPPTLVTKQIWKERYEDIRNFEAYLSRNGWVIRKVFLHVSREEQRRRLLARIDDPQKRWKFQEGDLKERSYWKQYMAAYDETIRETTTKAAPWYVVPADHKWYARLVISQILIDALEALNLAYPAVDPQRRRVLEGLRKTLT